MKEPTNDFEDHLTLLGDVATQVGGYRDEWLAPGDLLDTFTRPDFLPALETIRPCVLEGGRGTGKTTLLRSMSYEIQFAQNGHDWLMEGHARYAGLYLKLFTGYVRAFQGPELTSLEWQRLFQHYWNLEASRALLRYAMWFERESATPLTIPPDALRTLGVTFGIEPPATAEGLLTHVSHELLTLQNYTANVGSKPAPPLLTPLGVPIDALVDTLRHTAALKDRCVFFLLDEYEALLDYQQTIVNTLVKQSNASISFKIGVRELGFRRLDTLNPSETLNEPADYVNFPIAQQLSAQFDSYAAEICQRRLRRFPGGSSVSDIRRLFDDLSYEEEAHLFGVTKHADRTLAQVKLTENAEFAATLSPLELGFVGYWCSRRREEVDTVLHDLRQNPAMWNNRKANYLYAYLFTLRTGKPGIRKHYAGWTTLCYLAAGNTRHLLELVYESLALHLGAGGALSDRVSARHQTIAAQRVGRKNVKQLEGVSVYGGRLARLILGLGRVFGVLAEDAVGRAPEITQFDLSYASEAEREECELVLRSSIEHLALVRFPGTKLLTPGEVRESDYSPHPLFSALFGFSYRRKRKITVDASDFLALMHDPARGVEAILSKKLDGAGSEWRTADVSSLPDQLSFLADAFGRPPKHG